MSLAAWGVRKPVVTNLIMFALIGAGLVFGVGLRREFFPEINPDRIVIAAPYPGASPNEVEKSLTKKIEDRVEDLDGVKEVTSTSTEGLSSVSLEFVDGTDIDVALFEVKREMDAMQDLPEESDRIVVTKLEPNMPTIVVALAGDAPERDLKVAIRDIRDDLASLKTQGMGTLLEGGVRGAEVLVEVDPAAMLEYRVSLTEVERVVSEAMIELPGGSVRTPGLNVAIRTMGAEERAPEIRDIVVRTSPDGRVVRLGDIAKITPGFVDVDLAARLNGKPCVSLTVFKEGDQDAVQMAEMVKAYVAGRNREVIEPTWIERFKQNTRPPGDDTPVSPRLAAYELGLRNQHPLPGTLTTTTDLARFIVGRLDLLTRNAAWGGLLVLLTLILLLNLRVAFWTAAGLAISLMATLAVMYMVGQSLNLLTMFGLIIVLGLIVDDAIVVAENITARYEAGEPPLTAAVNGTRQVNWPVIATVLTTICAFLPLALIGGRIGDMLVVMPIIVACALGTSLIEALLILPSHMGHSLLGHERRMKSNKRGLFTRVEARFDTWRDGLFNTVLIPRYARFMRSALKYRYISFAAAVALVIVSLGMAVGGRVPFNFLTDEDAETVSVELRMPVGTPVSETDSVLKRIEAAAIAQGEVNSAYTVVGAVASLEGEGDIMQSQIGQLILELKPVEERDRSSAQVIEAMKDHHGPLAGIKSLKYSAMSGGPSGPSISLAIAGEPQDAVVRVANELKSKLAEFEGVSEISDDNEVGRRELQLRLRADAKALGFTEAALARQLRAIAFGLEAHTFAGDREDIDVRITVPESVRRSLARIEQMHVFAPDGTPVPLIEVAHIEEGSGYSAIRRLDGERVVTVTAQVDQAVQNTEVVMRDLQPELEALIAANPGVKLVSRGRQKDMAESFASIPLGMLVAAGLIFIILAWLFESYTQPLIVMAAIPFATIGAIWGHYFLGFDMTFLSLIGFIALSGVVVNDSLIYMEFYKQRLSEGASVADAALDAGRARLRAILLTTLTTVLGLMPLMLERSFQARFLIPMAITISCGLISATGIILVVLPSMLVILDDLKRGMRWLWSGTWEAPEGLSPKQAGPVA